MEPTNKKVSLLRIVAATIYDSLLMLGVWFLAGSLAFSAVQAGELAGGHIKEILEKSNSQTLT